MKFLETEEELHYKCRIRHHEEGKYELLPKTADWFSARKILPRLGDIVIPLEHGPVHKSFCAVHSVIWDTAKNDVIILLEKKQAKKLAKN